MLSKDSPIDINTVKARNCLIINRGREKKCQDRREPEAIIRKETKKKNSTRNRRTEKRRKNDEMRQLQEYGEVKIKKKTN
ncbi:hypothetical protein [Romboutsia timonensis]|uniref:hypothetical protein n=1 Tax=Romboutsia timonensis TaxID=1776391 RepID=UPI0039960FC8